MRTEIPLAEHFAAAFGSVPSMLGEYWELLGELRQLSPSGTRGERDS